MRVLRRILNLGLLGALGLVSAAGPAPAASNGSIFMPVQPRNRAVLAYALRHLHQKVGSGQCWDLVDSALRSAGADTSGDAAYVFGGRVARAGRSRATASSSRTSPSSTPTRTGRGTPTTSHTTPPSWTGWTATG